MIDIYYTYNVNGPGKVIKNLKLGLNEIGISYQENPSNPSYKNFGVFLQWNSNIMNYKFENILIGPNVCVLPYENSFMCQQNYHKCLVPSEWVKNLYSKWLSFDKIYIWPVGIETDKFSDMSKCEKQYDCLIYYKNRSNSDLFVVEELLKKSNQTYTILTYGHYDENTFINLLCKSKYSLVLGNTESQGIAIQEIMSCNLPIFVWDKTIWSDYGTQFECEATSVPYWNQKCGIKVTNETDLNSMFNLFLKNINSYNPRDFILENLSLKTQSKKILDLFKIY